MIHAHIEVDLDPPASEPNRPTTAIHHRADGSVCVEIDAPGADLHLTFGSVRYLAEWLWETEIKARSYAKAVTR